MMDVKTRCDKACEILRRTNDGDDLSPEDLWLVQEMVNGHLDDEGEKLFEQLYQNAMVGYRKPWFHGIENLTIDHKHDVRWKGKVVEHYNPGWCWGEEARKAALELAERCKHLESIGVEPSTWTAIWQWERITGKDDTDENSGKVD